MKHVISIDVKCPVCGAEPGEGCYIDIGDGRVSQRTGEGHAARAKAAEDAQAEPSDGSGRIV